MPIFVSASSEPPPPPVPVSPLPPFCIVPVKTPDPSAAPSVSVLAVKEFIISPAPESPPNCGAPPRISKNAPALIFSPAVVVPNAFADAPPSFPRPPLSTLICPLSVMLFTPFSARKPVPITLIVPAPEIAPPSVLRLL